MVIPRTNSFKATFDFVIWAAFVLVALIAFL
jgi:hypothetical protein